MNIPPPISTFPARRRDLIFLAAFFLVICSSAVLQILGVRDRPSSENRLPSSLPRAASLHELFLLPSGMDEFLNDRFIPRNQLIHLYYLVRLYAFGETVFPNVLIGQDGWLYYTGRNNIDDYQNVQPFTKEELASIKRSLDYLDRWLGSQGIQLVVAIAPNKESIHPEHLPQSVVKIGKESRSDQVLRYMKAHQGIPILDLRPPLLEARQAGQVYYRTDSHWNGLGSHAAYTAILEHLRRTHPELEPLPLERFALREETYSGDLANFLTLRGTWVEPTVELEPRFTPRAMLVTDDLRKSVRTWQNTDPNLPSVLMISDSFGNSISPLLAEHFGRFTQRFTGLPGNRVANRNLVERFIQEEHADIVILLLVERNLYLLLS
jgi:hypothetical protein